MELLCTYMLVSAADRHLHERLSQVRLILCGSHCYVSINMYPQARELERELARREPKIKASEDKLAQREVGIKTKELELKRREGEVTKREKVR